jgi:hypothetical protein
MSLIALSRAYPSLWGAPAIHAVDSDIFRLRYFAACMDCGFCADQCCNYGADIDMDNVERLKSLGADFERYAGLPAADWFDGKVVRDGEFPSGAQTRMRAENGHCIFLNIEDRGCRIHSYCLERGLDYHVYKSFVCFLFPMTFESGVLVPSEEIIDGSLACGGKGQILFDAARCELAALFGPDLVAELETVR